MEELTCISMGTLEWMQVNENRRASQWSISTWAPLNTVAGMFTGMSTLGPKGHPRPVKLTLVVAGLQTGRGRARGVGEDDGEAGRMVVFTAQVERGLTMAVQSTRVSVCLQQSPQ